MNCCSIINDFNRSISSFLYQPMFNQCSLFCLVFLSHFGAIPITAFCQLFHQDTSDYDAKIYAIFYSTFQVSYFLYFF